MRNKATWFNPATGVKKQKNSHTAGSSKGDNCKKTENKVKLCKARAHIRYPKLFAQWYSIFPDCHS